MRLRSEENIRRDFPSGFDFSDMPRRTRVHVRPGGTADLHVETGPFVTPRFVLRKALAAAEGLRAGDEDEFIFLLGPGDQRFHRVGSAQMRRGQKCHCEQRQAELRYSIYEPYHDPPPISSLKFAGHG